ncbi:MAG: glycoside hydrolase family 10 protein, partial [Bacteroidota bacterium]
MTTPMAKYCMIHASYLNRSIIVLLLLLNGCSFFTSVQRNSPADDIPRAEREFRAVWVATVANIDWPSKPGLSTEQQQKEALAILDTAAALNMNAIILQVRPHCDALYASTLEPWSSYLTGTQGKAPEPFYDPLKFWIDEAHKRGMELHAWFNPYRALLTGGNPIPDSSIVKRRPDLAKKINDGMYWLDPSQKETQDISYNVVMDVVKRYDVDGIHF